MIRGSVFPIESWCLRETELDHEMLPQTETLFALESDSPNRIAFNLQRVMNTDYRIDDFQETYFVLESFDALRAESFQDFLPIFKAANGKAPFVPGHVDKADRVLHRGTQDYANSKRKVA